MHAYYVAHADVISCNESFITIFTRIMTLLIVANITCTKCRNYALIEQNLILILFMLPVLLDIRSLPSAYYAFGTQQMRGHRSDMSIIHRVSVHWTPLASSPSIRLVLTLMGPKSRKAHVSWENVDENCTWRGRITWHGGFVR